MFSAKLSEFARGIRFRITLVYSTLFGLFICIFAFIISGKYLQSGRQDFDSALLNFAIDISSNIHSKSPGYSSVLTMPKNEMKKRFPFSLGSAFYSLRSLDGKLIFESRPGQVSIPYLSEIGLKEDYTHRLMDLRVGEAHYRALNMKLTDEDGSKLILQLASPSDILIEQRNRLILINGLTIPLLILVSSVISYVMAGNALAPVKTLTDTAKSIAAKNLSLRVPILETGDEIDELSKTFNNLLGRLESAFKAQENFVANASHQLNTPLAIIKGELDVLESKIRSPEDVAKFHQSLREELERLIELVRNMLLISRVEAGQENFVFHPIRIDELLLGVTSRLTPKAKEKRITIRFNVEDTGVEEWATVNGEKQLLDSVFENLLDNAVKYAPEESTIKMNMGASKERLEISIEDEGPGIPEDDLREILSTRFRRGTKGLMTGTGIGLSIAFQIARFHNANISYRPAGARGSIFTVSFTRS